MGYSVGIVGGGAAGMAAAVTAAGQGAAVTVLEGNDRLGKKILSTGNGKCNLGNENLDPGNYHTCSPAFLEACLRRFDTRSVIDFFQGMGLTVKSRKDGLYPLSEQAASVLDVLRYEVRRLGVEVVTECRVRHVEPLEGAGKGRRRRIRVTGDGKVRDFDRVILACGGRAAPRSGSDGSGYRIAEKLGHRLVPVVPALVQLKCGEDYFKSVAGVRAEAVVSLWNQGEASARERGEVQLTDYGISGIPVFQLSRTANYILRDKGTPQVHMDFFPDYSEEAYDALIRGRDRLREGRTVEEFFAGLLHKKLMILFIRLSGLRAVEDARRADPRKLDRVYRLCRDWQVSVTGSNSYENAQVCAGGVPLGEVTEDLESVKVPGVYFAGEILDVDGRCGGYNLHWAWCSGHIAGMAASGHGSCPCWDRKEIHPC